jgi:hypothetical protein
MQSQAIRLLLLLLGCFAMTSCRSKYLYTNETDTMTVPLTIEEPAHNYKDTLIFRIKADDSPSGWVNETVEFMERYLQPNGCLELHKDVQVIDLISNRIVGEGRRFCKRIKRDPNMELHLKTYKEGRPKCGGEWYIDINLQYEKCIIRSAWGCEGEQIVMPKKQISCKMTKASGWAYLEYIELFLNADITVFHEPEFHHIFNAHFQSQYSIFGNRFSVVSMSCGTNCDRITV